MFVGHRALELSEQLDDCGCRAGGFGSAVLEAASRVPELDAPLGRVKVLGIVLGASVVVAIPPAAVLIGVGLLLIWTVLSRPPAWMRDWPLLTGTVTSVLSMAFGASGPFVNTYVKSLNLGRHAHVATTAVLLTGQHLLKAVAFGVLGFAYAPWAALIAALILCGLGGTWTGKRVLNRMSDARFRQALNLVLLLISVRLVWQGLALLL